MVMHRFAAKRRCDSHFNEGNFLFGVFFFGCVETKGTGQVYLQVLIHEMDNSK